MTSKELNEILNITRRTPNISLTPEQVEELVKDLELLEKYKRVMCTPIVELMKELEELDKKKSDDIFVAWLKCILEVYNDKRATQGNLHLRLKENLSDPQGALRCIKEWLENANHF